MRLIGYARVSTEDQPPLPQSQALKSAGCAEIHEEQASGGNRARQVLARVLERVAKGEMLAVEDVEEILATKLLGVIPESETVLKASNQGIPVIHDDQSTAGQAYSDAVARLLGEEVEQRFIHAEQKGLFKRLFGRTA